MNTNFSTLQPGTYLLKEGGYFAGVVEYPNGPKWAVIIASKEFEVKLPWSAEGAPINRAYSLWDGTLNTMKNADSPAVKHCMSMIVNGHDDWYLPAREEWRLAVYKNLKPTNERSLYPDLYPEGVGPVQTNSPLFIEGGEQALDRDWYWTSSQYCENGTPNAWGVTARRGGMMPTEKKKELIVRPIRRIYAG